MKPISSLVSLTLLTPNLEPMVRFYDDFGLEVISHQSDKAVFKGGWGDGPQLTLLAAEKRGVESLTFSLRSRADADASVIELQAAGVAISQGPAETGRGYGFTIVDPDGFRLEFLVTDAPSGEADPLNERPLYLSHVVLNSADAPRLVDFYTRVLGFTISDTYEGGWFTFLRCDQPQHHCIGIASGAVTGLNHFAVDCGDVDAVMRSMGRMQRLGHPMLWGPGRHGPGGNIFCYFQDPDAQVPEFTCDVLQIDDPANWQAKEWKRAPANANTWLTGAAPPRAIELMSGGG